MIKQPKSLQLRRRYLLIESADKNLIEKVILEGIGYLGYSKALPEFVDCQENNKMILAINREALNNIRTCFELSQTKLKILKVSGTLKGLDIKLWDRRARSDN